MPLDKEALGASSMIFDLRSKSCAFCSNNRAALNGPYVLSVIPCEGLECTYSPLQ